MSKTFLQFAILFIALALLQVLIFNHLVLFNVAVCFIFIFLILRLPLSLSTNLLLTISFLLGLTVDVFSDTPGLNALACLIIATVKRPVFFAYVSKDDKTKDITPSIRSIGWAAYSKYALTMSAIFCIIVFIIEFLNFADITQILLMTASSTLFTFPVILGADSIMDIKEERH